MCGNIPDMPSPGLDVVYFVKAIGTDFVKIGKSMRLADRLRAIKTSCPHKIQLLGWTKSGTEEHYHDIFSNYRANMEWFVDDGAISFYTRMLVYPSDIAKAEERFQKMRRLNKTHRESRGK